MTQREIPRTYADKVKHLHGYRQIGDRLPENVDANAVIQTLTRLVQTDAGPIGQMAQQGDTALDLPAGSALTVIYHLLATQEWHCDLSLPLNGRTSLVRLFQEVAL